MIIKHQNLTPNGFEELITHVGTVLGSQPQSKEQNSKEPMSAPNLQLIRTLNQMQSLEMMDMLVIEDYHLMTTMG